jgi:kynurenine formamidase
MNKPGHLVPAFSGAPERWRVLDLSHAISDAMPQWPGDAKSFEARTDCHIETDGFFARSFWMLEHYGTHLDAPAHFIAGGLTVEAIPAERLFGSTVVFDVRDAAATNPDYELPPGRVTAWESEHARIPRGAIVLLRTGWASRWPDAARYRNQDAAGTMHFPGFGADAARILIERGVSGIACDTMSVDPGPSREYPVHRLALGAGLYHLENLADLSALPETGASLIVAPIKLKGGSGAPCRVFALLP